MDGWADLAIDHCTSDCYRPTSLKLLLRLIVLYLVLAALCHAEYLFRETSIEIEGTAETVGDVQKRVGRNSVNASLVRYHYRDPISGRPRFNTVTVPGNQTPSGRVTIEYIAGEPPRTRLKQQAAPVLIHVFFWGNAVLLTAIAGTIGWVAWDFRRPIARSEQRRVRLRKA